jgi:hypothetical protein
VIIAAGMAEYLIREFRHTDNVDIDFAPAPRRR